MTNLSQIVAGVNQILLETLDDEQNYRNSLPGFGGAIGNGSGSIAVQSLFAHRFAGKFEEPDDRRATELKRKCKSDWQEYDRVVGGEYSFYDRLHRSTAGIRATYYTAQSLMKEWLIGFKPTFKIDFSPGETFFTLQSQTSAYRKLSGRWSWTVTPDAAEDFITVILQNRGLRTAAKAHLPRLSASEYTALWNDFKRFSNPGERILRYRILKELLVIVHGSRASSVYKNREKRRFINIEPFGNVILQKCVSFTLRQIMKSLGNCLDTGQQDHERLIAFFKYATLDLANASDSTWLEFLRAHLGATPLWKWIIRYRSPGVYFDIGPQSDRFIHWMETTKEDTSFAVFDAFDARWQDKDDRVSPQFFECHKVSSMGNGFTFEIMSLVLLSLMRSVDKTARVYGDDIIVKNRVANTAVELLHLAGYALNETKSFIGCKFRESCGAFYHDDIGYITSYEIKWCENIADVVTVYNKLYLMKRAHSKEFGLIFGTALERITKLIPAWLWGPVVETPDVIGIEATKKNDEYRNVDLPQYCMHPNFSRKLRENAETRALFKDVCELKSEMIRDLQLLDHVSGKPVFSVIIVPKEHAHSASAIKYEKIRRYHRKVGEDFIGPLPRDGIVFQARYPIPRDVFQQLHWLLAGRVSKDTIRFDTFLDLEVHLVMHETGRLLPLWKLNNAPDRVRKAVTLVRESLPH